MTQNWCSI